MNIGMLFVYSRDAAPTMCYELKELTDYKPTCAFSIDIFIFREFGCFKVPW